MIGSIIGWAFFGLIVGALARLLHPGRDAMGLPATMMLGVVGSLVGGGVWYLIRGGSEPFSPGGFLSALICAIILLAMGLFARESAAPARRR
ncbi:GlsB/YeaQ/YmgE family stress response membrane protein [Tautonia sociabilis]|uniref:GlsB/YeaQ/YmgE family stress response membrane protein n=1 Tax=Tautonia sociabilis TaxID=2080755 RepID=A0A432MQH4_9BACT|nr:GlsB/YeaQ/YmgE family stress response membrane protein [Tautonia sociabilis]RUL89499.1 GlsB/YeaQ/YmgE family stress response membrane protein [Tautonia sociabilis]